MIKCNFVMGLYAGDGGDTGPTQGNDNTQNGITVTAPADAAVEFAFGAGGLAHADLAAFVASATATGGTAPLVITSDLGDLPNPIPAGVRTITFTATDADGLTATASSQITISEAQAVVLGKPTKIGYNAWSTMWNPLDSYNTSGTANPPDNHNPSVHTLVGQMYEANGITGYAHDFEFLPQGAEYIDGTAAMNNINTTASEVMVLSAYGSTSGITQDTATANASGGWIDKMVNAAQAAEARGIHSVMYQCWYSADQIASAPNAVSNTDALLAKHNMGIIRTAEILDAIRAVDASYYTNADTGRNKYEPPVETFFSGDPADNFHGSYAMNYMAALATFKYLRGINAADNAFVPPDYYGMSAAFVSLIKQKVDEVQTDYIGAPLEAGAAPTANNFVGAGTQEVQSQIDVIALSSLNDDLAIDPALLSIKTITTTHFTSYSLNNTTGVFTFTAANTFTGDTTVVFTYTDADSQAVDITVTLTISAPVPVTPATIWMAFGDGNGTAVSTGINGTYGDKTGANGELINSIASFGTADHTVSGVKDTDGNAVATLTAITTMGRSGFDAQADPEIAYAPDPALDDWMCNIEAGSPVQFSLNNLNAGDEWDIELGAIYSYDSATNPVDVDINGVTAQYNCAPNFQANASLRATVNGDGKLVFTLTHGGGTPIRGGIAFIELVKVV